MILYIILSYLIVLGMIIESSYKQSVNKEYYYMFVFSPIVLPIIVGMMLVEKKL
jgi:heme O synthase-like polyprenyltransferase